MYFPKDEYEDRWARVDRALRDKGYDAAVVWSRSGGTYDRCGDVLYFSNYVSTESGQEPDNKLRQGGAIASEALTRVMEALLAGKTEAEAAALGAAEAIIDAIKPGVSVLEMARLGERLKEEAGGGRDQAAVKWPIYGHGLGLFWEKPDISTSYAKFDMAFEPNMAFGIEAFLAHDGVGSAGFEQNIIVNETGTELLTATPMLWWE